MDPGGSAEIDFKLVAGGGTNLKVRELYLFPLYLLFFFLLLYYNVI